MRLLNWTKCAWLLLSLLFVSGCSIVPVAFTSEEISASAEEDKKQLLSEQEPVTGPISLYEAIARALSYNLDLRLEVTEKILSQRELDLSRYDQLPELVGNLDYSSRSNFSGANSRSLTTGNESLQSSTSSDRDVLSNDISLSWNILDFGLSYIRAQQAADRVLISEEQRRKVVNQLVQDVRGLYWRAVSNDRLVLELKFLLERVSEAISQSKEIEINRLDKPLTALTYQRELIGIKRELQELQRELSLAKIQLAALMNLRPGAEYQLVLPDRTDVIHEVGMSPQMMEELSLINRSELREIGYEQRINAKETKAAILQLLPGINLNFGDNHSSNSFLFNRDWLSYGARISWNLLNIFKLPSTKRVAEAQDVVLKARKLAMSMAILTQVHVGLAQFSNSRNEYKTSTDYYHTQVKILEQIRAAAETNSVSEQAVIREEMNTLVSEVKYDIAYADLENAYADAYAAIGVDPIPKNFDTKDIHSLTETLRDYFENISSRAKNFSMNLNSIKLEPKKIAEN